MNDTPRFGTAGPGRQPYGQSSTPPPSPPIRQASARRRLSTSAGAACGWRTTRPPAVPCRAKHRPSVHAPYYINMSSLEEDKRLHSIDYLCCRAAPRQRLWAGARHLPFRLLRQAEPGGHWKRLWTRWPAPLRPATRRAGHPLPGDDGQRSTSWAHWTRYWRCGPAASPPASTSGTCTPAVGQLPRPLPPRITPPCSTHWPSGWAMTAPCISHAHFSRIATTQGGENAIDFADTRSAASSSAFLLAAEGARFGPPRSSGESAGTQAETPPRWPGQGMRRCNPAKNITTQKYLYRTCKIAFHTVKI